MVRDAQGVWVSRDHELGYKKLFARGAAPDLDALDARLDVIAGKLADWGDTDNLDVRRAKGVGRAMLSIHLAGAGLCGRYGVARVEDLGPVLLDQVKDWLGHRNVVLKPVIDLNRPTRAADCYEVPVDIADAVHLRSPADCFPHATSTSRRRGDLDHTEPYKSPTRVGHRARPGSTTSAG